ncbi:unnamed protein product [Eruca vesicaria subsp. sativa]|uniref:RING-CH-type domain-containing protein n=1 Tax=Eruca vesicaria subsp. sativa TaxID=29727 RepID=A0ABC8IVV1_ERUVS|nr:unnamed protein product [Eruca vesicaria subsp. sativa]
MDKENQLEKENCEVNDNDSPPVKNEELAVEARYSTDSDFGLPTCRVCHCTESDRRGDVALCLLEITPPVPEALKSNADEAGDAEAEHKSSSIDIEMGIKQHQDALIELGCSCKNELALVHYACALKWFLNHGSTKCEICGKAAENIKTGDVNKVVIALRDYKALRERTGDGDTTIDRDEVDAIRRQQLSDISSWFGPHSLNNNNNNNSNSVAASSQPLDVVNFDNLPMENGATKWALEGTGILLAAGLLTVTLVWLIAPRVDKKTAKNGVHFLFGGLCTLIVVIFFRFVVLTRIRYGPARYWVILLIFWFLVFGVWTSRSNAHNDT